MKKLPIIALLLITAGTLSLAIAGPDPTAKELLFKLANPSKQAAARACKQLGQIIGTDEESGMFILRLAASQDEKKAVSALTKEPGVSLVLPVSARSIDSSSLCSVENHLRYLKASARGEHKDEGED